MEALTCPSCGAPARWGATSCPYCQSCFAPLGFDPAPAGPGRANPPGPNPAADPGQPAPLPDPVVPDGWVQYCNPYLGFKLCHPPGWEVSSIRGRIRIQDAPGSLITAWVWPFRSPTAQPAQVVASQFIAQARQNNPNLQAWQNKTGGDDPRRCVLRTRTTRSGTLIEGRYTITVNGSNGMISGFECPAGRLGEQATPLAQMLASFRLIPVMPLQEVSEPSERAFSLRIPQGWVFQGMVNRNNVGGKGIPGFTVLRDQQGSAVAAQPPTLWTYMDGRSGLMGTFTLPGGPPALPYQRAPEFAANQVVPWLRQTYRDLQVENVVDRPDLALIMAAENSAASGMPVEQMECAVACLITRYSENGMNLRQKNFVTTFRQVNNSQGMFGPAAFGGAPSFWIAAVSSYYRAPAAEFEALEPVLLGILDSYQANPAWKQAENQLVKNYIQTSAQDRQRRLLQISQTLSQTTDLITQSYWDRQQTYDKLSHEWSNAILGYQDMTDPSGNLYSIPTGYDRYWIDGLGNAYGGGWLTQPELNWQPLEPTGI